MPASQSLRRAESRFLILGTRWRINAKDELKCDGLLCKTCREGLQIFAVFKDERLQVDQLTEPFGEQSQNFYFWTRDGGSIEDELKCDDLLCKTFW